MKRIPLDDLDFSNQKFWTSFIATSFPTALDESSDLSLTEIIEENDLADCQWWDDFTGYYEGILEETDGYLEEPQTFVCDLTPNDTLKIEFHSGDTIYFINNKEIACTGPHYQIQIFSFSDLVEYVQNGQDDRIFLLLLPLVYIQEEDTEQAEKMIQSVLNKIFPSPFMEQIANSIVYGLIEE